VVFFGVSCHGDVDHLALCKPGNCNSQPPNGLELCCPAA